MDDSVNNSDISIAMFPEKILYNQKANQNFADITARFDGFASASIILYNNSYISLAKSPKGQSEYTVGKFQNGINAVAGSLITVQFEITKDTRYALQLGSDQNGPISVAIIASRTGISMNYSGFASITTADTTLDSTVASPGNGIAANSMQIAGSDGTNSRVIATDSNGNIKLAAEITVGIGSVVIEDDSNPNQKLAIDANGKIGINSLPGSPAQDGTDATGIVAPTGGVGIRGWLSGIYNTLLTAGIKIATLPSVVLAASSSGGATHTKFKDLAGTVESVKTTSGTLYGLQAFNDSGATAYIQIFDVAAASVVLGTTVPDLEIEVPTGSSISLDLPSIGIAFTTAISIASTTTEGGATGSAAGVMVFGQYA